MTTTCIFKVEVALLLLAIIPIALGISSSSLGEKKQQQLGTTGEEDPTTTTTTTVVIVPETAEDHPATTATTRTLPTHPSLTSRTTGTLEAAPPPDATQNMNETGAPHGNDGVGDGNEQQEAGLTGPPPSEVGQALGNGKGLAGQELPIPNKNTNATQNETIKASSVTVVVLGRSGTGISSTISMLIGPNSTCGRPPQTTNDTDTTTDMKIVEYQLAHLEAPPGAQYSLKLVDIPGLVDGRTVEDEARILSSLKGYLAAEGFPRLILVISKFDDNRIGGEHSLFVKLLKRVELVQSLVFGDKTSRGNTAFLLTRLMSETKRKARRPQAKIQDFTEVIRNYTRFPPPLRVVVGDNWAGSEHELPLDPSSGYYTLPNGDQYPKNVWQALLELLAEWRDGNGEEDPEVATETKILSSMMNNRVGKNNISCRAVVFSPKVEPFEEDVHDFQYLLKRANLTFEIEANEVNGRLDEVYFEKGDLDRVVQKVALQLRLQTSNISSLDDIPRRPYEQIKLFQKNKFMRYAAGLLDEAFRLRMPPYGRDVLVGHGFAVMKDAAFPSSPFRTDLEGPSDVGFRLPSFLRCRPLAEPEIRLFHNYAQDFPELSRQILKNFDFPDNSVAAGVNHSAFGGRVKEGFNLGPEGPLLGGFYSLSVVKEVRSVKCNLRLEDRFPSPEFLSALDSLPPLDLHDKAHVGEWVAFFDYFGSHVVTQAYGGGRLVGSVSSGSTVLLQLLNSQEALNQTFNSILEFSPVPELANSTSYTFAGGELDRRGLDLVGMEAPARAELLERWEQSLQTQFSMLDYELKLEPISSFVPFDDDDAKRREMEAGVKLLLEGQLYYKRRPRQPGNSTGTRITTTTTTHLGGGSYSQRPTTTFSQSQSGLSPPPAGGSPSSPSSGQRSLCDGEPTEPSMQAICKQLRETNQGLSTFMSGMMTTRSQGNPGGGHELHGSGGAVRDTSELDKFLQSLREEREERQRRLEELEKEYHANLNKKKTKVNEDEHYEDLSYWQRFLIFITWREGPKSESDGAGTDDDDDDDDIIPRIPTSHEHDVLPYLVRHNWKYFQIKRVTYLVLPTKVRTIPIPLRQVEHNNNCTTTTGGGGGGGRAVVGEEGDDEAGRECVLMKDCLQVVTTWDDYVEQHLCGILLNAEQQRKLLRNQKSEYKDIHLAGVCCPRRRRRRPDSAKVGEEVGESDFGH